MFPVVKLFQTQIAATLILPIMVCFLTIIIKYYIILIFIIPEAQRKCYNRSIAPQLRMLGTIPPCPNLPPNICQYVPREHFVNCNSPTLNRESYLNMQRHSPQMIQDVSHMEIAGKCSGFQNCCSYMT